MDILNEKFIPCGQKFIPYGQKFSKCIANLRGNLLNYSNKSPTRCNNFPVYYPDVYLQLNMFRSFSRPSSGAQ